MGFAVLNPHKNMQGIIVWFWKRLQGGQKHSVGALNVAVEEQF